MLKWVFFDVGDVILNEDRLRYNIFRILNRFLPDTPFERLLDRREKLILEQSDSAPHYTIARRDLSVQDFHSWQDEVSRFTYEQRHQMLIVMPGVFEFIAHLQNRYSLGIVANQPAWIVPFLTDLGILPAFGIVCISDAINLRKPDPAIFEFALEKAGCDASDCLLIGDRLDNDIRPAKKLGWNAVWLRIPVHNKGFHPESEEAARYLESLKRVPNWNAVELAAGTQDEELVQSFNEIRKFL